MSRRPVQYRDLSSNEPAEASSAICERVIQARALQRERFATGKKTNRNARMGHSQIKEFKSRLIVDLNSTHDGALRVTEKGSI